MHGHVAKLCTQLKSTLSLPYITARDKRYQAFPAFPCACLLYNTHGVGRPGTEVTHYVSETKSLAVYVLVFRD